MVRLVFRPYTQVRRSICTSEALRTSTRVSSGFILLRHSSPSFGYQRIRSTSAPLQAVETGLCCSAYTVVQRIAYQPRRRDLHFHFAYGFSTQCLAYTLDSLVRVSRRVEEMTNFYTESRPRHYRTTK